MRRLIRPPFATLPSPRPTLQMAILGASLAWLQPTLCNVAHAQTASVQKSYAIAPGPLGQVLGRFASESGVILAFDTALTTGKQSQGLSGSYSVEQGFARLLAGSELTVSAARDGTYQLYPAAQGAAVQLGATNVKGRGLDSTTEGTGSYTTGSTSTATKMNLSMRETPQSVSVVTRQRMDDQGMSTLDDAVKSAPGLQVAQDNFVRKTYYARGFSVDNMMYDGLPTTLSTFTQDVLVSADLAMYDRIEIVRGATGLAQGAGNPAAAINLVRKRPTDDFQARIGGHVGTWDNYRSEFDISGPLNESKTLRGRVVAAYQDKNSFQKDISSERGVFYAVGEADLSDDTLLTFGISRQNENNNAPWGAIPVASDGSDLGLKRSTNLGNDWNYWDQDNTVSFAELRHQFRNGWNLKFAATQISGRLNYLSSALTPVWGRVNQYNQSTGEYRYKNDHQSYDVFAEGPFTLLGREHELLVGASHRREHMYWHGGPQITATNVDPYTFDTGAAAKPTNIDLSSISDDAREKQTGTYATSRFSLTDATKLIIGARLDWYENKTKNITFGSTSEDQYNVVRNVTRYAGLTHDLDEYHTVYVSYTDIFKPQSYRGPNGSILKPVVGSNYEIGIKGSYFNDTLNASAALFRIDQKNRAQEMENQSSCGSSSLGVTCYEASGKVRSQGVDLEVNGALTSQWQLGAGYTFTAAKYLEGSGSDEAGQRFQTDFPRHSFKVATSYDFAGALDNWRLGANARWQSAIYNKWTNTSVTPNIDALASQGSFVVVDAMVGFTPTRNVDLQLNLNNIFDRVYYASLTENSTWFANHYGEPRNMTLSASYTF